MMNRRVFLASTAVLAVTPMATCEAEVSIAQIIAQIQSTCGFLTDVNSVVAVIISILSTFNASAGAAATVAVDLAKRIEDMICGAVMKTEALASTEKRAAAVGQNITVVVNGVPVVGKIVGPPSVKQ